MPPSRRHKEIPTGVTSEDGNPVFVKYCEVGEYVNQSFFDAYQWWVLNKILEFPPYSSGWMEWPENAVSVISAFNTERNIMDKEKWNKDD